MGKSGKKLWWGAVVLAALGTLLLMVSVQAASVTPTVVNHAGGGGAADCYASDVNSTAPHAFWISNPGTLSGLWITDPATGAQFKVTINGLKFNFEVRDDPNRQPPAQPWRVADVVAKGARGSNWYNYDGSTVGPVAADTDLGAAQNRNLSHVSFCYGVYYKITGTKFHDRDTDAERDDDNGNVEEGLAGWTIRAYNGTTVTGSAVTNSDGYYEILVAPGDYTVCEVVPSLDSPFKWKQSYPTSTTGGTAACSATNEAPLGHAVTVFNSDVTGKDFGNHKVVTLTCGSTAQSATLSEEGKPTATVTLPANCPTVGPQEFAFDHGVAPDNIIVGEESISVAQFVVFGGNPAGSIVISQQITWLPEDAVYDEFSNLLIPPTLVVFTPGGNAVLGVNCASGQPDTSVPDCRYSRVINEGGTLPAGKIQITEVWRFLGDPGKYR